MANLTKRIKTFSNGTYQVEIFTLPSTQYYMHKEDREVFGSLRSCVPCPAIMILKEDSHAFMSRQWQYYLRAINYNMELINVQKLLHFHLAFANWTGLGDDSDPRADFFFNKNLSHKLPNLDKVRTTSRSSLTGKEQFSLAQGILGTVQAARAVSSRRLGLLGVQRSLQALLSRSENVLNVKVFDSRELPTLKPGYNYPNDISEVDPAAYAIMPKTHPEMFLVANIVNAKAQVVQFPRGATYPWIDNGLTPYSFVPHIANLAYGLILYPLRYLDKVPLGQPAPRAYRA